MAVLPPCHVSVTPLNQTEEVFITLASHFLGMLCLCRFWFQGFCRQMPALFVSPRLLSGPGMGGEIKGAFVFIQKCGHQTLFPIAWDSVLISAFLSFSGTCAHTIITLNGLSSPHPLHYAARLHFCPFLFHLSS